MPISQNAFDDDIQQFIELAASLDLATIEELRKIANRLADSPDLIFEDRIRQFVDDESKDWQDKASSWVSASLASAYLRGINVQEAEISSIVSSPRNQGNPIPAPFFADQSRMGGSISDEAADILEDYPEHWSVFSRYESTMQEAVNRARLPFYRSTVQHYRDLASLSMKDTFRTGDRATRRELAQQVMDTFTDSGIKTISFPTNHRMSVEAFAKREARSYMQKVAVEGQINRATEMGYDLVRINQYAGASQMCAPHQGNVYSVGGNSSQYPPLSSAIHDGTYTYGSGIYHDYCGHYQSTYVPGVSESLGNLSDDPQEQAIINEMGEAEGNRFIYEARQQQRKIEYNIRKYKRMQAGALDKRDRKRFGSLIRKWQKEQRTLLDEYDFLKRDYSKESVL